MSTLNLCSKRKSLGNVKNFSLKILVIGIYIMYTKIRGGERMNDKKTQYKSIRPLVIIGAVIAFFLFLLNFEIVKGFFGSFVDILTPFIIGFAIAYLLNSPLNFFENTIFSFVGNREKGAKLRRVLAIITTMLSAVIVLTTLISIIIPLLSQSVSTLLNNTNNYIARLEEMVYELVTKFDLEEAGFFEMFETWEKITTDFVGFAQQYLPNILNYLPNLFDFSKQLTSGISSAIIGIIISIYLLYGKERFGAQIKKLGYAVLKPRTMNKAVDIARFSHKTFNRYIIGTLIDSLVVCGVSFVVTSVLRMPFPLLLSVIIGVTNIVPFFGPIVGGIIGGVIVVMVDPSKILWFVIFVVVLQQIEGNIIAPRILGGTTGLPAFWVLFSIIVFGGMFGFVGMFVGVPFFSVVYALIREYSEKRLRKKNMPTSTGFYYMSDVKSVEEKETEKE